MTSLLSFNSHIFRTYSALRVFTEITLSFQQYVKQKASLFAGFILVGEFLASLMHEETMAVRTQGAYLFQVRPRAHRRGII